MSDAVAPNTPCYVPNRDVVSECGLSQLSRSNHADDETDHDVLFVHICVDELENADHSTPKNPLFSMRKEEPLDDDLHS